LKYSKVVVDRALDTLRIRRESAILDADKRRKSFTEKCPEIEIIERSMSEIGLEAIKAISTDHNPKEMINDLKKKSLEFQKAKKDLLESQGFAEDYLDIHYTCPKCKDTGYVNGIVCSCYKELLNKYNYELLSKKTSLALSEFDDFDLSLYKNPNDRKTMSDILNYCKEYASQFDLSCPSIYMFGETGLGKTHLSLAIAGEVIKKGYNVIYGSAYNFFNLLEREHFGRSEEADGTTEARLINCDLLIIDDLGSEFITQFSVAELYNIVDSRISKSLPTIITSNFSYDDIEKKYNIRLASRIMNDYYSLNFVGDDIRQIKKDLDD